MKNCLFLFILLNLVIGNLKGQTPSTSIQDLKQELLTNPSDPKPYLNLGLLLSEKAIQSKKSGDLSAYSEYSSEAMDYFHRAMAMDPTRSETYRIIGMHYFQYATATNFESKEKQAQQFLAAKPYLSKAAKLNPNASDVQTALRTIESKAAALLKMD